MALLISLGGLCSGRSCSWACCSGMKGPVASANLIMLWEPYASDAVDEKDYHVGVTVARCSTAQMASILLLWGWPNCMGFIVGGKFWDESITVQWFDTGMMVAVLKDVGTAAWANERLKMLATTSVSCPAQTLSTCPGRADSRPCTNHISEGECEGPVVCEALDLNFLTESLRDINW